MKSVPDPELLKSATFLIFTAKILASIVLWYFSFLIAKYLCVEKGGASLWVFVIWLGVVLLAFAN